MTADTARATLPPIQVQGSAPKPSHASSDQGHSGFSAVFHELLDIINPLQHIPVISTIYRHLTGDEISPVAKVAGGALFGGVIGLGLSLADVIVQEATGEDTGDHVLALLEGKSGHKTGPSEGTKLATSGPDLAAPKTAVSEAVPEQHWFPAFPAGGIHPGAISLARTAGESAAAPLSASRLARSSAAAVSLPAVPSQNSPVISPTNPSRAIPQMDQATFDALLRSFGGKAADSAPKIPNEIAEPSSLTTTSAGGARQPPGDARVPGTTSSAQGYDAALKAMQGALDRYQARGGHIPPPLPLKPSPSV